MGLNFRSKRTGQQKNLPYLSHEFVIQNHGDIVTCIFMVFIVGLMFQITTPLASVFIIPSHNVSEIVDFTKPVLYTYGLKDLALVVFYSLACIIVHAIIQEYILDKINKKLKLSKTKTSEFNDSGQLIFLYFVSAFWLLNIFKDDGYSLDKIDFLWNGYPHIGLAFWTKMFFIIQLSYWVHVFPELYFQKARREEIPEKVQFGVINLLIVLFIYVLNLSRVGLVLLFIDSLQNTVFHTARLLNFTGRQNTGKLVFSAYNFVFLAAKILSIGLAVYVFLFGLKSSSVDVFDFANGNFNTPLTRYIALGSVVSIQLYQLWAFISYKFFRKRESKQTKAKTQSTNKKVKGASSNETSDNEVQELSNDESQPEGSPNGKMKAN